MRAAVLVVFVLMVSTPSEASQSCMTKTEARQHFGSVHIYWHGGDHCWDATASRRYHRAHGVQQIRQARQIGQVQQKIDQPKWYDSMSQMLPDEEPAQTSWADRWVDIEPLHRRIVGIVAGAPAAAIERDPEPMLTPGVVVMAMLAIALILALVELLFGAMRGAGRTWQRN